MYNDFKDLLQIKVIFKQFMVDSSSPFLLFLEEIDKIKLLIVYRPDLENFVYLGVDLISSLSLH